MEQKSGLGEGLFGETAQFIMPKPNARQSEKVVILRSFESEDEEVEQSVAEKH